MIKLKNGFYVKSDGLQFLLCTNRESTNKTTNEKYNREETLAYCGNMEQEPYLTMCIVPCQGFCMRKI